MKKVQNRTMLCILICFIFALGIIFFLFRYTRNLENWTLDNYYAAIGYTPTSNYDILIADGKKYYTNDTQSESYYVRGSITDRNNTVLAVVTENGISYNSSASLRTASLHAVGDRFSNIATGALRNLSSDFSRYETTNGEYTAEDSGNTVVMTIDSSVNQIAYNAFGQYKGCIGVYNYKTGEILCMVSTPTYDPENVPADIETNSAYSGAYINRFFSSAFTPGSTMKTITLQCALDTVSGIQDMTFNCTGSYKIGNQVVNCTGVHGTQSLSAAYGNSCNCAFAQIALLLKQEDLKATVDNAGLTKSMTIDGNFKTGKGSYDLVGDTDFEFAWSAIGLHHDLVNPCELMTYLGAVANGGRAAIPTTLLQVNSPDGKVLKRISTDYTDRLINPDTAEIMREYMVNNTVNHSSHYGTYRFNVSIGAKTGTIDRADGGMDGWLSGFVNDERYPYAFVCFVENGGYGVNTAGGIAAQVINALCK